MGMLYRLVKLCTPLHVTPTCEFARFDTDLHYNLSVGVTFLVQKIQEIQFARWATCFSGYVLVFHSWYVLELLYPQGERYRHHKGDYDFCGDV